VTTGKRASVLPDLPTMNDFYPGFVSDNWYAMFMPKNAPKDAIGKLNAEVKKALSAKEISSFYAREGLDPVGSTPVELTEMLKREIVKYEKVITQGNIRLR
jgi:tripartite-type tricarboxylate transporter receptor subunit TctC